MTKLSYFCQLYIMKRYLKIHERDNVVVALENMVAGDRIEINQFQIEILEPISLKHKIDVYKRQILLTPLLQADIT